MTTGNANLEDLTDEQLEAAQRAADGETTDTNPTVDPNAPDTTAAAADAAATTAAAGTPNAEADAAAATAAGAEATDTSTARIEGIASKDGSRILPFAALQAERRSARIANSRLESATRELEEAKQLIADLKAGKVPESPITEADVAQMEEDFPEQGRKMRALFERAQALEKTQPVSRTAATEHEVGDDPVQDAIDQVPLLVEWQTGDAEKFERAQEHDRVLSNSPKWANKSVVERFTHVAKLVADEYDIPFPEPKTSAKTTPSTVQQTAAAAPRAAPNTLSDFKGGAVADHGTADTKNMTPQSLLRRYEGMSDAEIDADLARLG